MMSSAPVAMENTEPKVDFNDVFSLRKPKDAKAGLSSGLKSVAKGVIGGVAGLFVAPVVGASQNGVVGFAKGVCTGVVGAVVLPVTGVGVGVVQVARGVANQGDAIVQNRNGKIWDEERRMWVDKPDGSLVVFEKAVNRFRRPGSGDDYYALLQVQPDATPEQIKKQYYMLARMWHPDKNPNDESAHLRFQKLGEAYQVLSNEELRARYDQHGSEGLDVNFMDGGELLNMLFGNDQFEHLVGELIMAVAARSRGEITPAEMKALQTARVDKLSINLKAMLMRHVQGDPEGFKFAMREEAAKLAATSFGETMLHALGKVYEGQANVALGNIFEGAMARMKLSNENIRSQFQAASAAIKVYQAQQKMEAWQREADQRTLQLAQEASAKEAEALAAAKAEADALVAGIPPEVAAAAGGNASQFPSSSVAPGSSSATASGTGNLPSGSSAAPSSSTAGTAAATSSSNKASGSGEASKPAPQSAEDIAERNKMEEAALPLMLEAMWAANVLDIQATLRKVCKRVLEEPGVSKTELKQRGLALRELGKIFSAAKAPTSPSGHDPRKQMEEAMQRVMDKRQQQDA